eukprot:Rhum_TRINITY_DN14031_c0_g1::Rhum_TRINITY_DN14031_c0_g1_i1::g.66941::m.66941
MAFVSPKMRRIIKGIFAALDEDGDGELNAAERSVVDDALAAGAGAGADAACAVRGADGLESYLCRWDGGAGPNAAATLKWMLERVIDTWGAGDDRTLPLSFLESTLPPEELAAFRAKPVPASNPPLPDCANLAYLTAFAAHSPTALTLVRQHCTKEAAPEAAAPAPVEAEVEAEAEGETSGEPSPDDGSPIPTAAVAEGADGAAADGTGSVGADEMPSAAPEAAAETEVEAEQNCGPVDDAAAAEGAGGAEAAAEEAAATPAGEVDAAVADQLLRAATENDAAAAAAAEPTLQQLEAAALSRLRALRHARAMGHGSGRAASESSSGTDSSTDSSESFSVCPDFPPPPATATAAAASAAPTTHHRAPREPRPTPARAATPSDAAGAPVRRSDGGGGGGGGGGASLADLQQEVAHLSRLRTALEGVHVAAAAGPQPLSHQRHPSPSLCSPVLLRRPLFPERGLSPPPPQPLVAGQPLPWWPQAAVSGDTCVHPAGLSAQVAQVAGGGGDGLRTAAEWQKARGGGARQRPRVSRQGPPDCVGLRAAGCGAQQQQRQRHSSGTHHARGDEASRSTVPSSSAAAAAAAFGGGSQSAGACVYVPPQAGGGSFARRSGCRLSSADGKGRRLESCNSVHVAYVAAQATRRSTGGFSVDT